jgi:hypothetical protein
MAFAILSAGWLPGGPVTQIHFGDSCRESSVIAGGHEQTDTPACKTTNWPSYNDALKRRGSLTIWFDPVMTRAAAPVGKP